jgi:hypothetical protein
MNTRRSHRRRPLDTSAVATDALARMDQLARETLARAEWENVLEFHLEHKPKSCVERVALYRTLKDAGRLPPDVYLFVVGWQLNIEAHLHHLFPLMKAIDAREEAFKAAHGEPAFRAREAALCAEHDVTPDDIVDLLDEDLPQQWLTDLFEDEYSHYESFPEFREFEREREGARDRAVRELYQSVAPDLLAIAQADPADWRRRWEKGRSEAHALGLWKPQRFDDLSDADDTLTKWGEYGPTGQSTR